MALQVVGAGFGRTGTLSLKVALEQLGYVKCHHMKEVAGNRRQENFWHAVSAGERIDWDDVFDEFAASCDWPSAARWQELHEHFPDSKVILTQRDPDRWYDSVAQTIYPIGKLIPPWLIWLSPRIKRIREMIFHLIWDDVFDGRFEDRAHALRVFTENSERVKRIVPPDRLLVFEAKDGWRPLCAFLDKPIPETPYPHVNEAAEMKRVVVAMKALRWLPLALGVLLMIALAL